MMKNPSDAVLNWLDTLGSEAGALEEFARPKPYYSQRLGGETARRTTSLSTVVRRFRGLVTEWLAGHWFAQVIGFDCVDYDASGPSTIEQEFDVRLGKPNLWALSEDAWTEHDLWDAIEVFHDLVARPTRGRFHSWDNCGFHPEAFSIKQGQAIFRWRVNELLDSTSMTMRLADSGEDVGRVVRMAPPGMADAVDNVLASTRDEDVHDVRHAITLFRSRGSTRETKRSAVVSLAGVLESRRKLIQENFLSKDEGALFFIANSFDIRHRNAFQQSGYDEAFLDWIFYWYLSTIELTNAILCAQEGGRG